MFSAPPATTTSASPVSIYLAALLIASSPEPHKRLTLTAGVSISNPALIVDTRDK